MHTYLLELPVIHIDCYRIESERVLFETGIMDELQDLTGVAFIEWGEKFDILKKFQYSQIDIRFSYSEDHLYRYVEVNS